MLHTTLVHLSTHYSWHYFDTECLAHHSSVYVSEMGKAVIKSYCYNASLNTDLTLL